MRRILALSSVLVLALPCTSAAQTVSCFDCILGIYDDPTFTTNFGLSTPGVPKDVYLSIDFAGVESELTGIEFSIAGMRQDTDGILIIGIEEITPGANRIGSIPAPADTTSTSTGTGGMNIAWPTCLRNDRALARITLLHFEPLVNHVFQVKRRYPTTNPTYHAPVFTRCDVPFFSAVRVTGGCYMLNWNGDPNVPCAPTLIGIESEAWSGVKQLFR